MKKFILSILFVFILQSVFGHAYAQEEPSNKLTCDQIWEIVDTEDCERWVVSNGEGGVWCNLPDTRESLQPWIYGPAPKYTFTPGTCKAESGDEPEKELESEMLKPFIPTAKSVNDWIKDTFSDLDFEAIETERLYGRTPQMTEEIIRKAQEDWKAMTENVDANKSVSPYRLDILNGEIQIKLPGSNEWSDLKQGDKIPSGSTIFTGMDSTTVLSITGKGVVQVQSFTEITISEKGLEQAAEAGQTFTEIDLKTGEIEVNIESGVFTAPILQVNTPSVVAGVRGTHFWVSYDKNKGLSTVGVYEGTVDVKVKGSDQSTLVSPNGDKPGVVMITQKLSVWKIVLVGLALASIIGFAVFFIKKRN